MWRKFGISLRSSSKARRAGTFLILLPYLGSSRNRFTDTEIDLQRTHNPRLLELFDHHLRHHRHRSFQNHLPSISTLSSLNMLPSRRIPPGWLLDLEHSAVEILFFREVLLGIWLRRIPLTLASIRLCFSIS